MSFLAAFLFFCVAAGILVAITIYDAYDRVRYARQAEKSRRQMQARIQQRRREMGLL